MSTIKVKKLHKDAKLELPKKAGDAGYDIYAADYELTYSYKCNMYKLKCYTGIAIELPKLPLILRMLGFEYVTAAKQRSNSSNLPFMLANIEGVIDNGYRGEIKYIFNVIGNWQNNQKDFARIESLAKEFTSQAIGQLLFEVVNNHLKLKFVNNLSVTDRGVGGFGHTNK